MFNEVKDFTDTYIAVSKALQLEHEEIVIYGGLGARLDHTLANLNILKLGNISLVNNQTKAFVLDPGTYEIDNEYKYISFFALEDVSGINLRNFKYQLEDIELLVDDPICISNEGKGTLEFTDGLLLVIQQDE